MWRQAPSKSTRRPNRNDRGFPSECPSERSSLSNSRTTKPHPLQRARYRGRESTGAETFRRPRRLRERDGGRCPLRCPKRGTRPGLPCLQRCTRGTGLASQLSACSYVTFYACLIESSSNKLDLIQVFTGTECAKRYEMYQRGR